ncbi:nucleotide exchange factor SIL1 [Thrips palmi]|uniref:Nucleotide exchange factor SIL1 n=1 Tax=Thrips palmi TaxID=161013 RepID=A0A6P9ADB2_THRPL|nr:nucleotide exchange factor SIL1 [Thrips palmi]
MRWIANLFLNVALVALLCQDLFAKVTSDKEGKSESSSQFVATNEWQKVEKGQPLPSGLHYRLNINTGETEVKLLEPTGADHKTGLVAVPADEQADDSDNTSYMSKDELKKVLAGITSDDVREDSDISQEQNVKEKYRSYEELKNEFGSLNITVKTDMEILKDLFVKAKQCLHSNENNNDEEIVSTLQDLEYLVHQIDNAREFIRLGGVMEIVVPALNSTSPKVRADSLWLLGSATQSNPKVQIAVLNAGIMPKLVKAIVLDPDATVHARAIYALSCLTRQFPAAQVKLIEEGGLESLRVVIDDEKSYDLKTKMRVITLINDLLLERVSVREAVEENEQVDISDTSEVTQKVHQHKRGELKEKLRQYNSINFEKRLVEDGWCHRLSVFLSKLHESGANSGRTQRRDDLGSIISKDLPYRPEHDVLEKVIDTLLVMKDLCLHEFRSDEKLEKVLRNFLSWYQDLSIREEVLQKQLIEEECTSSEDCLSHSESENKADDTDMYYTNIAETLKQLLKVITVNNIRNEL